MRMVTRNNGRESGVVLLLTLVSMVLISALVAAILYVSSSEMALLAYQRQTAAAFDGALGGMEEARSRLSTGDNMFIGNWMSGLVEFPNAEIGAFGVTQALYIVNPAGGETVAPWVATNEYYDWQYGKEFGAAIEGVPDCPSDPIVAVGTPPPSPPIAGQCKFSVLSDQIDPNPANVLITAGIPQASYKWVRVTLASEKTLNRDVDGNGTYDPVIPVFWTLNEGYTGEGSMNVDVEMPRMDRDGNGVVSSDERRGRPVYRITSMSKTPTGGIRLLQYEVSGVKLIMRFPGAISLLGEQASCGTTTGDDKQGEWGPSGATTVNGNDQAPGGTGSVPAIAGGSSDANDKRTADDCAAELAGNAGAGWTGSSTTGTIDQNQYPNLKTTDDMLDITRDIKNMADQIYTAPDPPPISYNNSPNHDVDMTGLDLGQCSDNYQTNEGKITVLDGNAELKGIDGCGVLLITGNATVSGTMKWKGTILVIGNGDLHIAGGGIATIDGALLLSKIYCGDDILPSDPCTDTKPRRTLTSPGASEMTFAGGGKMTINYNSFWIGGAFNKVKQQVLGFRELGQIE